VRQRTALDESETGPSDLEVVIGRRRAKSELLKWGGGKEESEPKEKRGKGGEEENYLGNCIRKGRSYYGYFYLSALHRRGEK